MALEVQGRRPVGRSKKTWSKVVKEDMRKLNITEDMAKDRKQWSQLIPCPTRNVNFPQVPQPVLEPYTTLLI